MKTPFHFFSKCYFPFQFRFSSCCSSCFHSRIVLFSNFIFFQVLERNRNRNWMIPFVLVYFVPQHSSTRISHCCYCSLALSLGKLFLLTQPISFSFIFLVNSLCPIPDSKLQLAIMTYKYT